MTETTIQREDLKFVSHSIAAMMAIVDVATTLGLGFDYVVPVLLAFPQLELNQTVTAVGVLLILLLMQVLFLPLIAYLYNFPRGQG